MKKVVRMANMHIKRYSTSLDIKEKQIKITIRYHLHIHFEWLKLKGLTLLPVDENVVQMELSNILKGA